jgi:hypothetical protein
LTLAASLKLSSNVTFLGGALIRNYAQAQGLEVIRTYSDAVPV